VHSPDCRRILDRHVPHHLTLEEFLCGGYHWGFPKHLVLRSLFVSRMKHVNTKFESLKAKAVALQTVKSNRFISGGADGTSPRPYCAPAKYTSQAQRPTCAPCASLTLAL
jgi:hypothetical protein